MTKEPVALGEIVKAAAVLIALFGLDLTDEQIGALVVLASVVGGLLVRARVSPVTRPRGAVPESDE